MTPQESALVARQARDVDALEQGFLAGSANISELDPGADGLPVLRASENRPALRTIMSNNFGFGGTNACVVFQRPED